MEAHLTALPPDIIRRIIRIGSESTDGMCLISRSWNDLVNELFSAPAVLERVYLYAGVPEDEGYRYQYSLNSDVIKRNEAAKKRVHLAAIIPHWCGSRVGVGKWLNVFEKHVGGGIEVACTPRFIAVSGNYIPWYGIAVISLFAQIIAIAVGVAAKSQLLYFLFFTVVNVPSGFMLGRAYKLGVLERQARARFVRFLSSFDRIETLVLGDLVCTEVQEAACKSLGNTQINRLELRVPYFGQSLQYDVIKLARHHGIIRVHVTADKGDAYAFRKFILKLSKFHVTLDLFIMKEFGHILNMTTDFWDEIVSDMQAKKIILKVTTINDASFNHALAPPNAQTHIQLAYSDEQQPVRQSRGFLYK